MPSDGWAHGDPTVMPTPTSGPEIKKRSSTVVPKMTCRRRLDVKLFRRR